MKMHLPQILFAADLQLEHAPTTCAEMTTCWVCRISTVYLVPSSLILLITWHRMIAAPTVQYRAWIYTVIVSSADNFSTKVEQKKSSEGTASMLAFLVGLGMHA